MEKLKVKGIWIPIEIIKERDLNDKEKVILSIILCLSSELGYCFASNRYFADLLDVTINRASKLISSLQNKGYIEVKLNYVGKTQRIKSRELKLTDKLIVPIVKNNKRYCQTQQYPIVKNDKDIINIYKKYYNKYSRANFKQREYTKEELESFYSN